MKHDERLVYTGEVSLAPEGDGIHRLQVVTRTVRDRSTRVVRRLVGLGLNSHLIKFLMVGVASFAIDLGLLAVLHDGVKVDLWIATPMAFVASLAFNFYVQKKFTFQSIARAHMSFLKYGALVVFNVLASDVIVNVIAGAGHGYAIGKVVATVATTAWNFLLYKHWIFKSEDPAKRHEEYLARTSAPSSSSHDGKG